YHAADGTWAFVSAEDDASFAKLCAATGRADLASDARFKDVAARKEHAAALAAELEPVFMTKIADAWEQSLIAAGVGCVRADAYVTELGFNSEAIKDLRDRKVVWAEEPIYP